MRVNQLWEVRWCRRDGIDVDESEWLWIIARTVTEAGKKAVKFLKRRKTGRPKVTGIAQHGTVDVF